MKCQKCTSNRVASVSAKASDCHNWSIGENDGDGYLPHDLGIGGGDYIEFSYCLNCGQIQGDFPLPVTQTELSNTDEEGK